MWIEHLVPILGAVLLTSNEALKCTIKKGCFLESGHMCQAHPGAAAWLEEWGTVIEPGWGPLWSRGDPSGET